MPLTVLSVGYTLAPVSENAVGGSEQILSALDRALVAAGHHSIVVANRGSETAGTLVPTLPIPAQITEIDRRRARDLHRQAIERALSQWPVDLIHSHALDFADHLPAPGVPTLVTLHLPLDFYRPGSVPMDRPGTYFNCVSASQRRSFPEFARMLPEIENGVPIDQLQGRHARRNFALALGRICPEKGFEHALDAARIAETPLLLAGQVFPYESHQAYFAEEIVPRLGPQARFLGPVALARKRRLLNAARCLLVPSLVPETSSLVAMEAIACGTPVIAFRAGALTEVVEHGVTGFLVDDFREMAEAIQAAADIDPAQCRAIARRRFSLERMIAGYFDLYQRMIAEEPQRKTGSRRSGR
ncbi:MAG: glycosyltransferase family 4 protein [Alphaproteobacteria bacterium]|nr:glycosyltransferase family 4 protein [Alphaproteobacteria bacterium]